MSVVVLASQASASAIENDVGHPPLNHRILSGNRMSAAFRFQPAFVLHDVPHIGDFRTDDFSFVVHLACTSISHLTHRLDFLATAESYSQIPHPFDFVSMMTKFFLIPQPGSPRYKLRREDQEWERECLSVYEALVYVRLLPDSEGQPLVVLNKAGEELTKMTV